VSTITIGGRICLNEIKGATLKPRITKRNNDMSDRKIKIGDIVVIHRWLVENEIKLMRRAVVHTNWRELSDEKIRRIKAILDEQ
jgi:hypothetical protein